MSAPGRSSAPIEVDAFTSEAFVGNPAAVCLLAAPRDELWMQSVARGSVSNVVAS